MAERRPSPAESWYRQPAQSGGGILTHSGSHLIDVIRFLLGEPMRVDARVRYAPDIAGLDRVDAGADRSGARAPGAVRGRLHARATVLGHTGEGWEETVEVIGEAGRVRLSSPNWQATAPCLITLQRGGEREARTLLPGAGSPWEAEMQRLSRCRGDAPPGRRRTWSMAIGSTRPSPRSTPRGNDGHRSISNGGIEPGSPH